MLHKLIETRYSPKAFSNKSIEPEKLMSLFEAAKWAPSSRNEQPWRFILGIKNNDQTYEKILSTINDKNRQWAASAPVLIIAIAKENFDYKDRPNNHSLYDVGQAIAYLTLQATAMELYVHQMGGFDSDLAKSIFEIPDGYSPVVAIAVGYLGSKQDLPAGVEPRDKSKRTRKSLDEILFMEKFGIVSDLVKEKISTEV
ncbi:MAG: hypothetical protein Kow0098_05050 [Ignavibacteriaceae bacterium]